MSAPLPPSLTPFAWVTKRDGCRVPFDADRISQSLFAATASLGRPDAFLARELTDGVLHFLSEEADGVPTTEQIAETVVKVVRELGQPVLSQAFADRRSRKATSGKAGTMEPGTGPALDQLARWVEAGVAPAELAGLAAEACLRTYALRRVFAPDVAAAHDVGLVALGGVATPLELDSCVLGAQQLVETVEQARNVAGRLIALDGPEHDLLAPEPAELVRSLASGLRAARLAAVVNLNMATPPTWAEDQAGGPLFADHGRAPDAGRRAAVADALLEACVPAGLRVDWHLHGDDFAPGNDGRLLRVVRLALDGAAVSFVFDRPRRPVALAEGLDRAHPAVLLTVGLNLSQLRDRQPETGADVAPYLRKLASLARLALSAAVQKREFLRRHRPALARGFLLDRARLVVVPLGLEVVARTFAGEPVELAGRIVQQLRDTLRRDGDSCRLDTAVDSAADLGDAAGLTFRDAESPARSQLRAAGDLHAAAAAGTAALIFPAAEPTDLVGLLRYAWQQTGVLRLRLVPAGRVAVAELPFRDVG